MNQGTIATPEIMEACAQVMFAAVQSARGYTATERNAWLGVPPRSTSFQARLAEQFLATVGDEAGLQGFATLRDDGYLDLLFVRPEAQGKGVADQLLDMIEGHARDVGLGHLTTHASHPARSFLTRKGWQVTAPNTVERDGVMIHNFVMERHL